MQLVGFSGPCYIIAKSIGLYKLLTDEKDDRVVLLLNMGLGVHET